MLEKEIWVKYLEAYWQKRTLEGSAQMRMPEAASCFTSVVSAWYFFTCTPASARCPSTAEDTCKACQNCMSDRMQIMHR